MFSAAKTSGPSGYNINNSLRFRSSASATLTRTPTSSTNRKTWTWSNWIKRGNLGVMRLCGAASSSTNETSIYFDSNNKLAFVSYIGSENARLITTQVFRDLSAWYHIVVTVDTTQATAANRIKMYVNGNQVTAFDTATYPSQNYETIVNSTTAHYYGTFDTSYYYDGYVTDVNFIDGQALTPSSFGSTNATTGVWQPAKYTGTYGTNGFYLQFSNIATTSGSNAGLGKDFSGNGNYFNTNNISVTAGTTYDAMTDVPTNTSATVANYATWNPLERTAATYSEANLKVVSTSSAAPYNMTSTIQFPTTGKWYCEVEGIKGANSPAIGMGNNIPSDQFAMYRSTGVYLNGGISGIASSGTPATWTTGDIIGIAYDASAGTLSFYKNGSLQSGGFTSIPATGYFVAVRADSASGDGGYLNCGQRPFAYTPPTGFVALNTYNLPDSTIKKGNSYMDAVLYTGDGTTRTVSNLGFTPDFVWTKSRSNATSHILCDRVRGNYLGLYSDLTAAEGYNNYTQFNAAGSNSYNQLDVNNANAYTYVNWIWKADNTSGSSNTSGSITSTVSVNTTAGFSVVTYTGTGANATVGHGLGVAPKLIFIKRRNSTSDWSVYYNIDGLGAGVRYLLLNSTAAGTFDTSYWNSTAATSTVFSLGTNGNPNTNTGTYVAYCWAEIAGFSKFGSYTGNGSTDGPFIYLGFRPKFVMIKLSSAAGENWYTLDSARNTYNPENNWIVPNTSNAENEANLGGSPVVFFDFLSNGFKIKNTGSFVNTNGNTYIYMAFAENPFKNALAR